MPNWFCTREAVKADRIHGTEHDQEIDRIIESVSRRLEREFHRWFIPRTETRLYPWPQPSMYQGPAYQLNLDADLLAVTTLKTKAQDTTPTTISSSDFYLEPVNHPPYDRIEIDRGSTSVFEGGSDSPQRSISVAGRWGYSEDTQSSGTVASGLDSDAAATTFVCSDASLIDVGDALLIESEQLFVSGRAFAARGSILIDGALTKDKSEVSITVDSGHGINDGEVILVGSEQMKVKSSTSTVLSVVRAWNGTVLAAHLNNAAISVNRTLTVQRGVNGTTGAVHADATAVSRYVVEPDVRMLAVSEALATWAQEQSQWGREVGGGDTAREFRGGSLQELRTRVREQYQRIRMAAV